MQGCPYYATVISFMSEGIKFRGFTYYFKLLLGVLIPLIKNLVIKVIEITENGSFSDTLKIDKEGYYSLRIGRESTSIYLIKGKCKKVMLPSLVN